MNTKDLSDEALAAKAAEDPSFFGMLIDRYEAPLRRYLFRISNVSAEDVEDYLQEIFLKAWRTIHDFDTSLKFSSWIYRIAHNHAISAFRKRTSRGEEEQVELSDDLASILPSATDLSTELQQKITSERVREALEHLPEKQRDVLILHYLEEKKYEEISDIMRIPSGTVATLISRGKKAFQRFFTPHE